MKIIDLGGSSKQPISSQTGASQTRVDLEFARKDGQMTMRSEDQLSDYDGSHTRNEIRRMSTKRQDMYQQIESDTKRQGQMQKGSRRYKSVERVDFDRSSKLDLDRSSKIDFVDYRDRADLDRDNRRDNEKWNRSFQNKERFGALRNRTEPPSSSISTD